MSKKGIGSYYTPHQLASLIANETLNAWISKHGNIERFQIDCLSDLSQSHRERLLELSKSIRVLDPAVGEGAFLIAAANWLNRVRYQLGDRLTTTDRLSDIVKNSLFGVDLISQAVRACRIGLVEWAKRESAGALSLDISELSKIKQGNSLLGFVKINDYENPDLSEFLNFKNSFHWITEYNQVMQSPDPGFDVILGNPPYGNLLNNEERRYIQSTAAFNVGGGRRGSWNTAAHFITLSKALMKKGAYLGLLVPNSILRVNQFSKTRQFLLNDVCLWKIADEGNPFEDVTLEMVTLFCTTSDDCSSGEIEVESRRHNLKQTNRVSLDVFQSSKIFSIYFDSTFSAILQRGRRNLLSATRGRDIPKDHVVHAKSRIFKTPYITSGRSVRRYRISSQHQLYTDDWYEQDQRMKESYENELLVATKNYRYPRCVIKPKGTIHGGGIVKIIPLFENADLRTIGLILNSRLIKYICIRYLTNYSQLTTCLNTGIMESLPIVLPQYTEVFSPLFDALCELFSKTLQEEDVQSGVFLERLSDALVYELYFEKRNQLEILLAKDLVKHSAQGRPSEFFYKALEDSEVRNLIEKIMANQYVEKIEEHLRAD